MIHEQDLMKQGRLVDDDKVSKGSAGRSSSLIPAWKRGLNDAQQMYVLIQSGNEEALNDPTIEVEIPPEQLLVPVPTNIRYRLACQISKAAGDRHGQRRQVQRSFYEIVF